MKKREVVSRPGSPGNQADHRSSGMVLIIVLVVVFMLSFAGFSFVNALFTENKAAHLRQEEIQVSLTLDSAVEAIKTLVQYPPDRQKDFGGLENNPELFRGRTLLEVKTSEDSPKINTGKFTVISPRIEEGSVTGIRFGLVNESSKLNLITLLQWEKAEPGAGTEALMRIPGMTEEIAGCLMDWIDDDSLIRQAGAESEYYEGLDPAYVARNQVPESMEELLLIKNVTRTLLYGIDQNHNFLVEEFEKEEGDSESTISDEESLPLSYYLTIYSSEKNLNTKGEKLININSPDLKKLDEELKKEIDPNLATFIIAYRLYGPSTGSGETVEKYSGTLDLNLKPKFEFKTILDLIGSRVSIPESDNKNKILTSPLKDNLEELKEKLPELMEQMTVDKRTVIPGRININQAPGEILNGIPGMTEAIVTQVLSSREQSTSGDEVDRLNSSWPYLEGLIDLETMKIVIPYITTGGDVYRAQIVGFYDNAGPTSRGEVVIDATKSPPQRIYWKDLQILGKGFPPEVLGVEKTDSLLME